MVGMSAMISATLMAMGVNPFVAMAVAMACCLVTGVINGMLVGKFKLPPFIATLGTMFVTRGAIYDFLFFADAGISDSREAAQGVQPLVAAKPPYRSAGKSPCAEISPRQSAHARKGV